MWATYQHERIDPVRDNRVFTNYIPDSVKETKRITNNEEYRRFLVQHTDSIIRQNYESVAKGNPVYLPESVNHGPPVRFNLDVQEKPFGYEDSQPKQMYLTREQLDQKKRRLLKEEY
jgi:hypothetical protein